MNVRIKILNLVAGVLAVCPLAAQTTYEEMEQLTVNEQVTTVITANYRAGSLRGYFYG